MGKKILSAVLVCAIAFLCGFAGGMLALQQSGSSIQIKALGQTKQTETQPAEQSGGNKIVFPEDITIAEAIAEKAMPSVVGISTSYETSVYGGGLSDIFGFGFGGGSSSPYKYRASGVGTGVIVDADGYILTNSHVVNDGDYTEIAVSLYDGRELSGKVLWNDITLDLAIVKVEANGLGAADLGDSDTVKIGSYVAAIGNPLGLEFERSMSQGIISGLNRTITVSDKSASKSVTMEGLIQTDATINSGNSGGPLFNSKGEVVAINSAKVSSGEGMGFAIPINIAKPIIEQVKTTGTYSRVYLGFSGIGLQGQSQYTSAQLKEHFGTDKGVYVQSVLANGGAAKAGIKAGDVITRVNGVAVSTVNGIYSAMVGNKAGDEVEVEYLRSGKIHSCRVKVTGEIVNN
jgi:serine protease Do